MDSKKIKIAIFLPNDKIKNITLSNPEYGNPGIGGTHFLLYSLAYYLTKSYCSELEIIILAEYEKSVNINVNVIKVDNLIDAAEKAKNNFCDIFIFRPNYDNESLLLLKKISELKLKSIAWMHTTPKFLLNQLNKNQYILRCVCVGREQYESMRDHPIIDKLSLVFNAVDSSNIPYNENIKKTKSVVFLGSLVFAKGFHLFAEMWRKVIDKNPDAQLIVIGSGKLYDQNQNLGNLGIAEESYEKMFKKYILDKNGNIDKSISFLGVLGTEKFEIMSKACVGLTNHPKVSETFCLAAVEFQLCGTPVVSASNGGLLDTVIHNKTGFLVNKQKDFVLYINKLLQDIDLSSDMGKIGRESAIKKFNYDEINKQWLQLFKDVYYDTENQVIIDKMYNVTLTKKIREKLRILKNKFGIFKIILPSIYIIHTLEFIKLRIEKTLYKYF